MRETVTHHLLILSKECEEYKRIISRAQPAGLSVNATKDPGEAVSIGRECDLLFGEPSLICQVIDQLPLIIWVQSSWAGVEPLLTLGLRRDYILTNVRDVYGPLMSEYVFGYLLLIERGILSRWQSQLNGKWDGQPHGTLKGKLIGLLGVGTIGAYLAKTAHHFRMVVHGFTRKSETCPDVDRYFHTGDLIDFASGLDYLVCTLPATPATKGIINTKLLSELPPKCWFVNIGRGSNIDEEALVLALKRGALAGAVLDVFEQEPLPAGHPFWETPNTFITSHTAAINYPPDIAALFLDNYERLLQGKKLSYQVDFEQYY